MLLGLPDCRSRVPLDGNTVLPLHLAEFVVLKYKVSNEIQGFFARALGLSSKKLKQIC